MYVMQNLLILILAQKRRRLNYSGMSRDFISVDDINWGHTEALKKVKRAERIQPEKVIDELGLIFSDTSDKNKACRKIRYHVSICILLPLSILLD